MAGSGIPHKYQHAQPGFTEGAATSSELQAAGFEGTTYHLLRDPDGRLRQIRFRVLRDPNNRIVATWHEGHWWTPAEFHQFLRTSDSGTQPPNRAARRRRRGR